MEIINLKSKIIGMKSSLAKINSRFGLAEKKKSMFEGK